MNYKRKRNRAGISAYTMSKELGVDYEKYLKVEKKLIPLEGEMLNKYQDVLKNSKMIRFNHRQKMFEIKQFIKDGKMRDLMAKRGYNGVTLARTLNIAPSEISHVLNGKMANEERIEMVYDFLTNPINANVEGSDKQIEIDNDFDIEELEKIMEEKGLKKVWVAEALNIPYSSLCKYFNPKYRTNSEIVKMNKRRIKDFIVNCTPSETPIETTPKHYDTDQEDINFIKQIRKETGKNYTEIAEEIGCSSSQLYKIVSGRREISESMYIMLKRYIDKCKKEGIISDSQQEETVVETPVEEITVEIPVAVPVEEEAEFEEFEEIVPISLGELEPIEIEPKNDKKGIDKCYYDIMAENFELKEELEKAKRQIRLYETLIEKIK
jgi:transcriptional regulator with XRE-family HTH domain